MQIKSRKKADFSPEKRAGQIVFLTEKLYITRDSIFFNP